MAYIEHKKGDVIKDSVEILSYKEGGLGRVYFGYCKIRETRVAIKTIKRDIWEMCNLEKIWPLIREALISEKLPFRSIDQGEYLYHIFFREAKLICQAMGHINVIKGYNIWWTEFGQPFFECEFVSNSRDLSYFHRDVYKNTNLGFLSCLQVAHIAVSFCNGMIYISNEMIKAYNLNHKENTALGFVHRDIKPGNILITRDNIIKIIDLGLAKYILAQTPTTLSSFHISLGTPNYMSPEHKINFDAVLPSSDIYSFGVAMYELLEAFL
ncbi:MAG: Serine/threonine-protein kinase PknA [Pelotomaculum sp. PtaB.Bin104]|nr:MAG: Serine/threonine-protein kinase PknA [Pelotomaculum sp. PtaB.Bin104]